MPPAKKPASQAQRRSPATFTEPAALKQLTTSLDAAQAALAELRKDTGRDVSQGARDLYNDLRAFLTSARRDTGKLAKALRRDFTQAQKQLARGTAGSARTKPAREQRAQDPIRVQTKHQQSSLSTGAPPTLSPHPTGCRPHRGR